MSTHCDQRARSGLCLSGGTIAPEHGARRAGLVTLPASNIAVPVHHSCAKTGDCDDNPYHEHRDDHALIAMLGDYGYQPGDPDTDPDTQQQGLVPTCREHLSN